MTIGAWLEQAKKRLDVLDAELILLFGLQDALPPGADRSYIFAHPEIGISEKKWRELDQMAERRAQGEPLAYILGYREFYGRGFRVNSAVLIPRPETEQLVELILGLDLPAGARILEVGTGSGCIAVTLCLERPDLEVVATDVSPEALEVARQNNRLLDGKVRFLQANLLAECPTRGAKSIARSDQGLSMNGLETPKKGLLEQNYDVLVANLPYVDPNWPWLERKSLDFEPVGALYAGENGLELYHKLLVEVVQRAAKPRWLVFEADPCQHQALVAIAAKAGYQVRKIAGFGILLEKAL